MNHKGLSLACLSVGLLFSASAYAANVSYDTKYNGHCYKLFNDGMTWAQAKSACERQGGHLVTITTAQEQAVVEGLLRSRGSKNNYWLGGYRNGNTWTWVTGERFSYTRWSGGQPDNFQGRENRLSMYRNRNPYASNNLGEWNDAAEDGVCNNEPFFGAVNFGYICEWDSDPNTGNTVTYKTLSNGWYKIHPSHARSLSLDAEGSVTNDGNNVHMWDNLDVSQQKFYLENRGNGYFSLKAGHKQTLYVTAEGNGNGANLATRPWNNNSVSQLFRLVDGGSGTYHIMAKVNENLNFDCAGAGTTAKTNAQLWTKETGSAHHKWIFEPTGAPAPQPQYSVAYPADGVYSLQPQCAPGMELMVWHHERNYGSNVMISEIDSNWPKWRITRLGNDAWYKIEAVHSGLAIDVDSAKAGQNGANIATWPYGGKVNQFRFLDAKNGYYILQANVGGNQVLDVANGSRYSGTNVQSYGLNASAAQMWKLVTVTNPNPIPNPIIGKTDTARRTLPAYSDSGTQIGRVDKGDYPVTVLAVSGDKYKVRYPLSKGGTKEGWVSKDVFEEQQTTGFDWPIPGYRGSYRSNHSCRHYYPGQVPAAVDISAPNGTSVYAPASGVVQNKGDKGSASFGKWFEILHDDGTITLYAHLSDHSMVWNGKRVNKGDLIAKSGNTGKVYGANGGYHLHFEMYNANNANMRPNVYFKSMVS